MSRGLGREQTRDLRAVATSPSRRWSHMEIQQSAWGAQVRTGHLKRYPKHGRPHRNVSWWTARFRSLSKPPLTLSRAATPGARGGGPSFFVRRDTPPSGRCFARGSSARPPQDGDDLAAGEPERASDAPWPPALVCQIFDHGHDVGAIDPPDRLRLRVYRRRLLSRLSRLGKFEVGTLKCLDFCGCPDCPSCPGPI
jgi:hypothetical protein